MPAKSKAQQRFFGIVDAYKRGEMKNASKKIKDAAKDMSMKDVKHFAKTKRKGLPEKVEEGKRIVRMTEQDLHRIVRESVHRIISETRNLQEVTDYGNNLFGSAGLNSVFNKDNDGQIEVMSLKNEIIDKLGNGSDRIENYSNNGPSLYLYGTTSNRKKDIENIIGFCRKRGFDAKVEDSTRYSGYNKYPAVKIDFQKI